MAPELETCGAILHPSIHHGAVISTEHFSCGILGMPPLACRILSSLRLMSYISPESLNAFITLFTQFAFLFRMFFTSTSVLHTPLQLLNNNTNDLM
jgi:hypothetical protein